MKATTVQITLPVHDNNGVHFPDAMLDALRQEIMGAWGGLTEVQGLGKWQNADGQVFIDRVLVVTVHCPLASGDVIGWRAEAVAGWWLTFAKRAATLLDQEAICLVIADEVHFVS